MQAVEWKEDYKEFEEVTRQFYAGEVPVPKYKGFSGGFGSYAQRGGKAVYCHAQALEQTVGLCGERTCRK